MNRADLLDERQPPLEMIPTAIGNRLATLITMDSPL